MKKIKLPYKHFSNRLNERYGGLTIRFKDYRNLHKTDIAHVATDGKTEIVLIRIKDTMVLCAKRGDVFITALPFDNFQTYMK
jgi:hypothetical protein